MADTEPPPSSTPADHPGRVIPLPVPARPLADSPISATQLAVLEQLTRADLGITPPANESALEPQPGWSEARAGLERDDLDPQILRAESDLARGDPRAATRLRALRGLRAMRSFERGDRKAAYEEWEALADEEPADPDPLLTRALFFGRAEDYETAFADYGRAAARAPNDPEVYRRRGSLCVICNDWARALPDFRRLVYLQPRDIKALGDLASALRFTGDHDGAIRVFGRAIKLAPWRAELYASRAACFHWKDAHAEQIRDLDQCIERDSKNAEAFRCRAAAHSRLGDEEREIADLDRAIELDPTHAGTFQTRAYRRLRRGLLDLALSDFTRAVELEPDTVVFRRARAELAITTGALDVALVDLDRTIEIQLEKGRQAGPLGLDDVDFLIHREDDDDFSDNSWYREGRAKPYWLRGHVHRRRGDVDRARADYERALEIRRKLMRQLIEDEETHRLLKKKAEHLDDLDTLLVLRPNEPQWRIARADVFLGEDELQKALVDLDHAIKCAPDNAEAFHLRARVHARLRDHAKAIEDESQAIQLFRWQPEYHSLRGVYRALSEGPSEGAEADILRAVELDRDDKASALFYQAWYLEIAERWEEAMRVYDRRVELYPDLGIMYFQRGEARLQLAQDESARRAALADFDAALERHYSTPDVLKGRSEVLALLDKETAAVDPGDPAEPPSRR